MRLSKSLACDGEDEEDDMEGGFVEQQPLKVRCHFFLLGRGGGGGKWGIDVKKNGFDFGMEGQFFYLHTHTHTHTHTQNHAVLGVPECGDLC